MEEADKQLQNLIRIKEYPSLLKKIGQLEDKIRTLEEKNGQQASEIASLKAVEKMVGDQKLTLAELKEVVTKIEEEGIQRRTKLRSTRPGRSMLTESCDQEAVSLGACARRAHSPKGSSSS